MTHRMLTISFKEPLDRSIQQIASREGIQIQEISSEELKNQPLPPAEFVLLNAGSASLENVQGLLLQIKSRDEALPVLVMSHQVDVAPLVEIMKSGAMDYLQDSADSDKIKMTLRRALQAVDMSKRIKLLESQVGFEGRLDDIVGASPQMHEIFQMIQTVAKSHATVLIMGESGTGKELVAKAIHKHSERVQNKFIDLNCGAIPKDLLENELFGHERGSFTGADRQYIGSCERAHGGTLFLDEIGEMDISLQVKLLRVLQERAITRIGGSEKIHIDIRVIAATNKDLRSLVEKGTFREDLYYRLNVVPIALPPIRARRDDIPLLAHYFLEKYSEENQKKFKGFEPAAIDALVNYDWPGNVREIENNIERIVVLNDDTRVRLKYLPRFIVNLERKVATETETWDPNAQKIVPLKQVERYAIENALRRCMGDVITAAKKLGIGQATLYRKVKKYGIKV
ncbi:MAG: sigma-54-dependent Fis family transcriptional regulator [Deltaproteobacteria bacterium]|nr:MAG: sigma-54-dependent Fis family transcriptional regulator [Deltaproteobacteria bacterium]